ncbi:hypothetical protein SLEP1_g38605 [Rubroshorea leprosula]|uniref:Secreted protein n=1 Tax=Rubroshorea leprosula TaxID=152421 RepID=A0AAV5KXM1_9ROSI|nr:hypothetical protein SLEP1_g38605 [Rubroshorea leprosula]
MLWWWWWKWMQTWLKGDAINSESSCNKLCNHLSHVILRLCHLCHAPEPKSEARQTPYTRETGPTNAQGSELTQQN